MLAVTAGTLTGASAAEKIKPPVEAWMAPAKGSVAWTKIRFAQGQFWIKTAANEVHLYQEMANCAGHFDTVCTSLGNCQPVTAAMRKHIAALPYQCDSDPYEVRKVATFEGKRYSDVVLQEVELGKLKLFIPRKGFVPTRNKDGAHTGVNVHRDCRAIYAVSTRRSVRLRRPGRLRIAPAQIGDIS